MSIFDKWSVLKDLKNEFVKTIKCVYVFGSNGDQVIVITNDDNVYAFGNNSNGCLGLGHTRDVHKPTLIPQLCQKQVIKLDIGSYNFAVALTKQCNVYAWGDNSCGQLANGNTTPQYKPIIITALNNAKVIDITTGKYHSFALTSSGNVHVFGFANEYDDRYMCPLTRQRNKIITNFHYCDGNKCYPRLMNTNNGAQKIKSIASGLYHALALSENRDVYYWGDYATGKSIDAKLCFINCSNTDKFTFFANNSWSLIETLTAITISKIACGPYHSLMLSTKGNVYSFGANNFGQCGDGTNEDKINPIMIVIDIKFVDIGATKNYDISVGKSINGYCYIWGKCGDHSFNEPFKTPFTSINEVLETYSPTKITYRPVFFKENAKSKQKLIIIDRISDKFNQREYSDIAFKVDNRMIYAQKTHLINVCKHFEVMFAEKNWIESNSNEIVIKDYSYSVYFAFIKYLYTDCVDAKPEESIELLDLANCYLDEELKNRCVGIIKDLISDENVIANYSYGVKYDCEQLKNYCIEYFHHNMRDKNSAKII